MNQQDKEFKDLIYRIVRKTKADLEQRFIRAKVGITPFQYAILVHLEPAQLTLYQLAHKLSIRPPSLAPALTDLERSGFLHRKKDSVDKRKVQIIITEKARRALKKLSPISANDFLHRAFRKLHDSQKHKLLELLTELDNNLINS